jgi:hypothetical protein
MIRNYRGQSYKLAVTVPYTRKDGSETRLHQWVSNCADCGRPFVVSTPAASKKFVPNRRCQRCKRPGQRVKEVRT